MTFSVLNNQTLWRSRVNASVFLNYDLLYGKLESSSLRELKDDTRNPYGVFKKYISNRIHTFRADYTPNLRLNDV